MSGRLAIATALLLAVPAARADRARDPGAGAVPPALGRELAERAAERGVPPEQALAPVAEAAARGVPVDLVAAKVLEGLSKGVPPARVAAVARELTERLARAGTVLGQAERAGLTPPTNRGTAVADLAAALGAGVGPDEAATLTEAARGARAGCDALVSAAHAVGELARRGVPAGDSLGLGLAIARHGPLPPGEIPALFDAWRAEGGKDARAFTGEAARRIEQGKKLDGLVDVFAETPDRIERSGGEKEHGRQGLGNDSARHGASSGVVPGKGLGLGKDKGKGPKK